MEAKREERVRVCNFPMKFLDREIAREIKFPDRESREIGKDLCTDSETFFFSDSWNKVAKME